MRLKQLKDEDFVNYRKPCMFIGFPYCTWKCDKDCGQKVCQNSSLASAPIINVSKNFLCERYINNPITCSIVCGGLEPFDSFVELCDFIFALRNEYKNNDDIVIYTGYTEKECEQKGWLTKIKKVPNIIIKFGRFVPDQKKHYDETLGVYLASDNQYARRIN